MTTAERIAALEKEVARLKVVQLLEESQFLAIFENYRFSLEQADYLAALPPVTADWEAERVARWEAFKVQELARQGFQGVGITCPPPENICSKPSSASA
jgi:hypothetical protein